MANDLTNEQRAKIMQGAVGIGCQRCLVDPRHVYRVEYDACPFCARIAEMQPRLDAVIHALQGATIASVDLTANHYGSEPDSFALILGDGRRVSISFWAAWADDSGMDIDIDGEHVFGKGY